MKLFQKENYYIAWVYQNSWPNPPGPLYFLYRINAFGVKNRFLLK